MNISCTIFILFHNNCHFSLPQMKQSKSVLLERREPEKYTIVTHFFIKHFCRIRLHFCYSVIPHIENFLYFLWL